MAGKARRGFKDASNMCEISNGNGWRPGTAAPQDPKLLPRRGPRKGTDAASDGNHATANSSDRGHGNNGNGDGRAMPPGPGGIDDTELDTILRELVESLIGLLEPRYTEVVWRAEILDQTPTRIAHHMNLSERTVAKRLQAGRRALLHLVMLTLQPSLKE